MTQSRMPACAAAAIVASLSTASVTPAVVAERGEHLQPAWIDDLVGDEEVVAEAGRGHADRLPWGGAREPAVAGRQLPGGERGALVGLDVGP